MHYAICNNLFIQNILSLERGDEIDNKQWWIGSREFEASSERNKPPLQAMIYLL